jgi:hypothetical protein
MPKPAAPSAKSLIVSPYQVHVSLGMTCNPAMILRDLGLRSEAYPFDWLISTPQVLSRGLNTGFSSMVQGLSYARLGADKKFYTSAHTPAGRFGVANTDWGLVYWHDTDPDHVVSTYPRRCQRLLNLLATTKRTLFVFIGPANKHYVSKRLHSIDGECNMETHYQDLCQIADLLTLKFPLFPFHILAINASFSSVAKHPKITHLICPSDTNTTGRIPQKAAIVKFLASSR